MDEVGPWLLAFGLEQYPEIVRKHEIDLQSIALLSDRDLGERGLASVREGGY